MPRIVYIASNGSERTVEARLGASVMETAVKNNVPEIVAECGGACACSTCHVYVDEAWLERTGARTTAEREMIEFVDDCQPNSRLSCQIKMTQDLDGLTIRTPDHQNSQL